MANANIGHTDCPVCGKQADVRATKKTKAYIHCDDCGFQGFARGFTADKILREKMRPVDAPKMVNVVPKVKAVEPEPVAPAEIKPAAEMTIFDHLFGGKAE